MSVEVLLTWHRLNAYGAILWMLLCALWGLVEHRRGRRTLTALYRLALLVAAALPILQVALGVALALTGLRAPALHMFLYGSLAPLILPGAFLYVRRFDQDRAHLVFGLVALFLSAFLVRATFTT